MLRFQKLIILVRCIRIPPPCRVRINVMYFGRPSTRKISPQWELWSLDFPNSIAPEQHGRRRSWCSLFEESFILTDQSVADPRFSVPHLRILCCVPSSVVARVLLLGISTLWDTNLESVTLVSVLYSVCITKSYPWIHTTLVCGSSRVHMICMYDDEIFRES